MNRNASRDGTSPTRATSDRSVTWARFAPCRDLRASDAIRDAVAAAERCDPRTLTPSLDDAVDTAAIDSLFSNGSIDARLTFRYAGYTVEIHGDGWVRIR